jgi:hypothetical protein
MIDTTNLGYKWRGNFDPAATYKRGDVVRKDGEIQSFTGSTFTTMARGQQSAPAINSLFRAGSNAPLTKAVGQELAIDVDGLPTARFDAGRRTTAAIALPKSYFRNSSFYHGGYVTNLALMTDGSVLTWGLSEGIGLNSGIRILPQEVAFPRDAGRMVKVFACFDNFMAIDQYGRLWGWGSNRNGCLGLGNLTRRDIPVLLNGSGALPANARIVDVEMGAAYSPAQMTIAITDTGEAYFAGFGFTPPSYNVNQTSWARIQVDAQIVSAQVSGSDYNPGYALIDAQGRAYFSGVQGYTAQINNASGNQATPTLWNLSTFKPVKSIQFADDQSFNGATFFQGQWGSGVVFQDGTIATRQAVVRGIDIRDPSAAALTNSNQFFPDTRINNVADLFVCAGTYAGLGTGELAVALKNDGTVWATGYKNNLISTYSNTNVWEQITQLGNNNVKMIVANGYGEKTFGFLKSNGSAAFIGRSGSNNFHHGSGISDASVFNPVLIRHPIIDMQMSGQTGRDAGNQQLVTTFLLDDGTLLTSGAGANNRLGNEPSSTSRSTPSAVIT